MDFIFFARAKKTEPKETRLWITDAGSERRVKSFINAFS